MATLAQYAGPVQVAPGTPGQAGWRAPQSNRPGDVVYQGPGQVAPGMPGEAGWSAPPTAPAAPAGIAAPGAPNYADEYQKAMAAASAGIANQFHMALSDIAQREGLAQQAVGQLPGQLDQVYNASGANMLTGAASLDAAQKASGLTSYMSAGAQMAPLSAAMGENKATAMSSAPLLALAVKTQMANERAALDQQHQAAIQSLAEQNLGNLSDQAKTANAQQYQTTAANQQHQWDVQSQQNQLQQQMTLAQLANDSRVEPKTNMTIGEINAVKQDPTYTRALNWIQGRAGDPNGDGHAKATVANLQKAFAGQPNLLKVLQLEFPDLK